MSEFIANTAGLNPIIDLMTQIMDLPEESLNDQVVESLQGIINGAITPSMREEAVHDLIKNFNNNNYTREYVADVIRINKEQLDDYVSALQPSTQKRKLLNTIVDFINDNFQAAYNQYHTYSFVLPIKLDEGAHEPTYAHSTDAAADIYALEDMTLAPHSLSNVVRTGLRIALPEGWAAYILPRSSIGMKSGLRLSNSVGVIDSEYRGEIGVMYDNHSDSDYRIHKGDRIAQMIVMPVHQFKPQVVDTLDETERGEGGFGSTGK